MTHRHHSLPPPSGRRVGLATIEFVMALTVLLLLVVALLWSGAVLRNAAVATVVARHDAWRQRRDARPRTFDYADVDGGRVTGAAERPVRISPLLDGRVLPRAETAVHGGSWDHRAEKLERSPNRRLYPVLLRQTVAGLADIDGLLGGLTSGLAENVQADGLLADIQNAADAANQKIGDLKKKVEEAETSAKQAARQEWQRILEAVTSERTTVQGKAATLDQRFADLQEEARMHAVREPKDAAHQEEAERIRKALEETRTERQPLKIRLQELDALEQRVRRQMGS
jgi:hypothetical protein